MEGSLLPVTPEKQAEHAYQRRMWQFEHILQKLPHSRKRRHEFGDYTAKNCEEAWAGRPG